MNVCGLEVSDGFTAWLVVAVIGCVLLGLLTGIAVLADQRYQRSEDRRHKIIRERASWRPPEAREEEEER